MFDDEETGDDDDGEETDANHSASQSHLNTPSRLSLAEDSPFRNDRPLLDIPGPSGDHSPKVRLAGRESFGSTLPRNHALQRVSGTHTSRRLSTASSSLPAIFANTGLQTPPALAAAYEVDPLETPVSLSAIDEHTVKDHHPRVEVAIVSEEEEKGWQGLPKLIIMQVCRLVGRLRQSDSHLPTTVCSFGSPRYW